MGTHGERIKGALCRVPGALCLVRRRARDKAQSTKHKAQSTFLALCLLSFVLPAAASSSDYTGWRKSDGTPQSVMLSYYDGPDTRGFAWQTATKVTSGKLWVVAGEHGSGDKAFDSASSVTAASESHSDCTTHKAHVTGLSAGTYSYRLGKDGGPYAYGTFAVRAEPQPFVLLNVNDIQTRDANKINYWEWTVAAAERALGGGRNADMIVSGGDFIDRTGLSYSDYVQWGVVADKARVKFADVAWTMSSGNHDTDLYDVVIDEHYQHTSSGHYGCHAYTVGNVHVAAIPYYDSWKTEVGTWLKTDLASASAQNATWRIVSTHYGPYTTGDHGASASSTLIKEFCGICAAGKVDLVLQAHDHTYSKTLPYRWSGNGYSTSATDPKAVNLKPDVARIGGVDFYVNPEGTVYVSAGCAGHRVGEQGSDYTSKYNSKRTYQIAMDTVKVKSSYASVGADASKDVGQPMFGVVTVDGDTLAYDWYVAANGQPTLFDTLRISKTPPEPPKDEDETIEMTLESSPVEVRTIAAQASWTYEVTGDEDCVGIVRMKNADGTATFELRPLKLGTANVIIYTEDGVTPLKTVTVIVKDVPKQDPSGSDEDVTVTMAAGTLTNFVTATASDAWSVKVSDDDYVSAEVVPNGYGQANVIIQALYPDSDSFTVKLYPNATMKSGTSVKTVTVRIVPPETSVSLKVGEEPFVDECWFFEARGWTVTSDPGTAADAALRLPDGSKSATAELTIVPVAAGEETVTVSRKASSGSSTTAMHVYHVTVTEKPKVEPSGEPEEVIAVTLAGGESFTRTFHADEARPWLLGATNEIAAAFGFDVPSEREESVAGYSLRTQEAVTDVPVTLTGQRKGFARIFVGRQDAEGTAIAARFDVTVTNNAPLPVRVIPDPVGKVCGADDPPLTYVTDPERTPEGDPIVLNGVLARASGEDIGTYDISLGTITSEANPGYLIALDESAAEGAFTIAADNILEDRPDAIELHQGESVTFVTRQTDDKWYSKSSKTDIATVSGVRDGETGSYALTITGVCADSDTATVTVRYGTTSSTGGTKLKEIKVTVLPAEETIRLRAGETAERTVGFSSSRYWLAGGSGANGTFEHASAAFAASAKETSSYSGYSIRTTSTSSGASVTITALSVGTETITVARQNNTSAPTPMYVYTVVVEPGLAPVVAPTATITYGTRLGDATIVGTMVDPDGNPVEGSFAFDNPEARPGVQESGAFAARFVPSGDAWQPVAVKVNVTVTKATYDMSGVTMEDVTVTYDGAKHSIVVEGLPKNVSVQGWTNNGKTDAGTNQVTATFTTSDADNYEIPAPMSATLIIEPAPITSAVAESQTWDGTKKTPNVVVKAGALSATATVGEWSGNLTDIGRYTTTVTGFGNFTGELPVEFDIVRPRETPQPEGPFTATITNGWRLADAVVEGRMLQDGETVRGWFDFGNLAGTKPSASGEFAALFRPLDTDRFAEVGVQVAVTVEADASRIVVNGVRHIDVDQPLGRIWANGGTAEFLKDVDYDGCTFAAGATAKVARGGVWVFAGAVRMRAVTAGRGIVAEALTLAGDVPADGTFVSAKALTLGAEVTVGGVLAFESLATDGHRITLSGAGVVRTIGSQPLAIDETFAAPPEGRTIVETKVLSGYEYALGESQDDAAFRTWCEAKGIDYQTALASPGGFFSFATDQDRIVDPTGIDDSKVKVEEVKVNNGGVTLTVGIDGVPVGEKARAEYLEKVFGVTGTAALDEEFAAEKVTYRGDMVNNKDGTVSYSAEPKVAEGEPKPDAFFFKARVTK